MHDDYCPDVDALFEERYCVEEPWMYNEDLYEDDDDFHDDDGDDYPMVGATDEVDP